MSNTSLERHARRALELALYRAALRLDEDGLRFIVCCAQVRGMNEAELGEAQELLDRIAAERKDETNQESP